MHSKVEAFVARRWQLDPGAFQLRLTPLSGGLESPVMLATVSGSAPSVPRQFVVKALPERYAREADIYTSLGAHLVDAPAPRVWGDDVDGDVRLLYLENVRRMKAWPWAVEEHTVAVCRALAALHDDDGLPEAPFAWDYEAQLEASARATLDLVTRVTEPSGARSWPRLGDLRRVVHGLADMRGRLLRRGTALLHGDVHPGNVLLRKRGDGVRVTLIDWSRARLGAPLEDVASWLHSLGCWEPAARRRHDTLLQAYLDCRRVPQRLDAALRRDLWFASASNGLAGAIRYHVAVLADASAPAGQRRHSVLALRSWTRVIRRSAAWLRPNRDRCM